MISNHFNFNSDHEHNHGHDHDHDHIYDSDHKRFDERNRYNFVHQDHNHEDSRNSLDTILIVFIILFTIVLICMILFYIGLRFYEKRRKGTSEAAQELTSNTLSSNYAEVIF